eukprot:TRINITY_DN60539_c0_g1_i1.p1 TRINITY_DN60539_c0_g1~~TRINITY_DN60539_c0_g1_i1.p1  ORF type:complete len:262 (+),score=38.71 TRINITY_DN60539_c0_g1_i1:153-938(+)
MTSFLCLAAGGLKFPTTRGRWHADKPLGIRCSSPWTRHRGPDDGANIIGVLTPDEGLSLLGNEPLAAGLEPLAPGVEPLAAGDDRVSAARGSVATLRMDIVSKLNDADEKLDLQMEAASASTAATASWPPDDDEYLEEEPENGRIVEGGVGDAACRSPTLRRAAAHPGKSAEEKETEKEERASQSTLQVELGDSDSELWFGSDSDPDGYDKIAFEATVVRHLTKAPDQPRRLQVDRGELAWRRRWRLLASKVQAKSFKLSL